MKISRLTIRNFKSIRELTIENIENALILVGKNNTGKTVVADAVRAVTGNYKVKEIDFSVYDKVVFLSKSVGTIEAGFLAEKLGIDVVQIYLTPVPDALSYIKEKDTVVMGTADEVYPECKEHCNERGIKPLYIEGANHSLEVEGKPFESLEILKEVMKFVER